MPACWDHWILLPQDLQSSIIKTSARGRLNAYGTHLLEAIRIWRRLGAWRAKGTGRSSILAARTIGEFVRLAEQQRRKTDREAKVDSRRRELELAAGRERPDPVRELADTPDQRPAPEAIVLGDRPNHAHLVRLNPWIDDNARFKPQDLIDPQIDLLRRVASKLARERPRSGGFVRAPDADTAAAAAAASQPLDESRDGIVGLEAEPRHGAVVELAAVATAQALNGNGRSAAAGPGDPHRQAAGELRLTGDAVVFLTQLAEYSRLARLRNNTMAAR
jgi:hypothetical protein